MKFLVVILAFLFISCDRQKAGWPVVKGVKRVDSQIGKYFIILDLGSEEAQFWSDSLYHVNDTLVPNRFIVKPQVTKKKK